MSLLPSLSKVGVTTNLGLLELVAEAVEDGVVLPLTRAERRLLMSTREDFLDQIVAPAWLALERLVHREVGVDEALADVAEGGARALVGVSVNSAQYRPYLDYSCMSLDPSLLRQNNCLTRIVPFAVLNSINIWCGRSTAARLP